MSVMTISQTAANMNPQTCTLKSVKKPEKPDRNELRRVRCGRDAIEQTLDLHGLRAAIAQKS